MSIIDAVAAPAGWHSVPFGRVASRTKDVGRPDLQPLSVFLEAGVVPRHSREDNHNQLGEDLGKYLVVKPGDLVFNKLRTWQGGLGASSHEGIVSPAYFVCRPGPDYSPRFLQYLLLSDTYLQELTRVSKWQPPSQFDISWEQLRAVPIVAPAVELQRAIANYLDNEMGRIDALIIKTQRMIELFREHRQALLASSVTGDARGGGMSARLKSLASLVVDQTDRGELPYLALEHLESSTGALVPNIELQHRRGGEPGLSAVRNGDVLFGKLRPYLAKTLLVRESAYASTELMALRPTAAVDARYLSYLVGSRPLIEWATASSDGTKMPRTSWEKLSEYRVTHVPELADQRAIADYLDAETRRIGAHIVKKRQMIELLRERRQALLTAAVTGEIAVPVVAA